MMNFSTFTEPKGGAEEASGDPRLQDRHFLCAPVHHGFLENCSTQEESASTSRPQVEFNLDEEDKELQDTSSWRPKERMKTVNVALVMCLNIGTDPPDTIKTSPCAKLECWVDPTSLPSKKTALESIGQSLQQQYERLQPRARYKQCLDPTAEDLKKLCLSMRRAARGDRVLVHYNGHGVPRPTSNGEIWVFNKGYTQYIPLSIYDLRWWTSTPSVYVLDCSMAGVLLPHFLQPAPGDGNPPPDLSNLSLDSFQSFGSSMSLKALEREPGANDCIVLVPCGAQEVLPVNPYFPADTFTACLTTPIRMALRWFVFQNRLWMEEMDINEVEEIPGRLSDRKTLLGELNWIFTAITDTIAWNALPGHLFQKLFRQDLLLASLFRNFLLGDRVLRSLSCTPVGIPPLPPAYNHPLWQAWDMAVECCLAQVQKMKHPSPLSGGSSLQIPVGHPHASIPFFAEQLTAFEIWLDFADSTASARQPEQLPVVLQVLLSQAHRLRALQLLQRFLELGAWAVNLALSVGIFPYVLKLLQAPTPELRQVLVSIWARILAYDTGVQVDLVKDNSHVYFINHLTLPDTKIEQRIKAAFILTAIMDKYQPGQDACLQHSLHKKCFVLLDNPDVYGGLTDQKRYGFRLQAWLCLCIASMCLGSRRGQYIVQCGDGSYVKLLIGCLASGSVEVRCAATYALGVLFTSDEESEGAEEERKHNNNDLSIAMEILRMSGDCSPLVRREAVLGLATLVLNPLHFVEFVRVAKELMSLQRANEAASPSRQDNSHTNGPTSETNRNASNSSIEDERASGTPATLTQVLSQRLEPQLGPFAQAYVRVWLSLRNLQHCDPFPAVVEAATHIIRVMDEYVLKIQESRETLNGREEEPLSYHELYPPPTLERPRTSLYANGRRNGQCLRHESMISDLSDRTDLDRRTSSGSVPNTSESLAWLQDQYEKPLFLKWMCQSFSETISLSGLSNEESIQDPLCYAGAMSLYLGQRNQRIHFESFSMVQQCNEVVNSDFQQNLALRNSGNRSRSGANLASQSVQNFLKLDQAQILESDSATTSLLLFHGYEPLLVVADDKDHFSLWAYNEGKRLLSFSNGNKDYTRLSTSLWVNERSDSLLLTGSTDGVVRVWGGLLDAADGSEEPPYLVTAFHMAPDLMMGQGSANLVSTWNQQSGYLISGGSSASIRVLDLAIERFVMSWQSAHDAWVTALADYPNQPGTPPGLEVAGYSNGSLRLFDTRFQKSVLTLSEHDNWIINTTYIKDGAELVSGDAGGGVRFWDARQPASPLFRLQRALDAPGHPSSVSGLAVHPALPILASGSHSQFIKTFTLEGETLSVIRYHDGFLGQRIGPVSYLTFHPFKLLLAAGATDSIISIYAGGSNK